MQFDRGRELGAPMLIAAQSRRKSLDMFLYSRRVDRYRNHVEKRAHETAGAWTLKLAEALGWPAGLAVTSFGTDEPPIVVAGGMGEEAAWREWVASFGDEGNDDLTAVWAVLDRTMELIAAGIDPGPPATWDAQAIAASDAEEAEEERLSEDTFGRPFSAP